MRAGDGDPIEHNNPISDGPFDKRDRATLRLQVLRGGELVRRRTRRASPLSGSEFDPAQLGVGVDQVRLRSRIPGPSTARKMPSATLWELAGRVSAPTPSLGADTVPTRPTRLAPSSSSLR